MSLYKVAGIKTFSGVIRIFCTSLLFLVSIARVFGQELPPIQSFAATTYNADNQNWSISQSQDKLIYVANNKGLLQYNGANWKLYETPDKTIMRSVKVVDEKIYTGSHQEFGFWVRDERDMLKYTSLSQNLKIPLLEDEEFWRIEKVDKWIVFQSLSRIYILDPEDLSVNVVESTKKITDLYPIGSQLYYHQQQKGIFEIKNGKSELTSSNTIFLEDDVINIFAKEDRLIVLTKSNGFYAVKDNKVSKITSSLDDDPYVQIYCSILLSDRSIAIGTIANGILILDESLTLKYKINQNKGLLNNTVLDLFEDYDKNLWVGLDNGINLIEMESPIRVFTDLTGSLGSVYTTIVFEDQLFIGTNQGLFRKDKISNEFELLGGTKGQVWYLTIIEESLYIGHHNGTFVFKKDQLRKIDGTQGTWNVKPISDEILIQGTYNGLYVLQKEDGDYTVRNKVEGFNYSARHLEIIDNTIIVNHEYKGLFVLTMDNNFEEILEQRNEIDLKDSNSGLARADNQILYACSKGVFKFDVDDKAFIRDSLMSTIYDQEDYISGKMIVHEARDETWFFSQDRISRVKSGGLSSSPKIEHFSISQKSRRSVIEYESIIPCDEKNYLIGTSFGYLQLSLEDLQTKSFDVYINSIDKGILNSQRISSKIDQQVSSVFDYQESLRFNYYTPAFLKFFPTKYQYKLVGQYDDWSEWSENPFVVFENIPAGKYAFQVRSKIGGLLSTNVASYQFVVKRPWYASTVMLILYVLGVIGFSVFIHNVYKRYYRKQQEMLIAENQRELKLSKLETEKRIIKIKNEQLQKDYKDKSNELAASTMSIIRKNELLSQVKKQLSEVEDKEVVKPVIKIIDKNLNHTGNWELFQEAFNNVDSEFLKMLKSKHANLSPNDLKLCAYLRLNLTSKEVAQLINISPRSVEVKRYRLRKKLNLSNDENLTEYILSI